MAAFVEGALTPAETAATAEHLRGCPDCRTVVAETARFEAEESGARAKKPGKQWWLLAAAVLIAIVALPLLVLRRNETPLAILVDAAPVEHRYHDARVSGFPFAPLRPPARGGATPDPADLKLSGAAGVVLERTEDADDEVALHARGVALLLIERHTDSITALERAAAFSNDARTWNDLSAARYTLAVSGGHLSQLPLALADADRALKLDPKLPEAHFNRALVLQRMGLNTQARREWEEYLALDPSSEWSLEARARLRSLDGNNQAGGDFRSALRTMAPAELVRRFPQESRTWGEGLLLAEWADAEHARDAQRAAATLALVRALADEIARTRGEHLLDDAVTAVERADAPARAALVEAYRAYRDARVDFSRRQNVGGAEKAFRRAEELFHRGDSPMEKWAAYYAASATFHQNRVGEAHDALLRLAPGVDPARYRALTAQIHWELAVHANLAGDWGTAARESEAGARIFASLGEPANEANLRALAAPALESIGETDLAWKNRLAAIASLSPARRQGILHAAALTLAWKDDLAAAGALLDALIAEEDANAMVHALVLADRTRIASRGGDAKAAEHWLGEARAAAARVPDPGLRDMATAHVALAEAAAQRSIGSSDRAIAIFAERRQGVLLPDAYLQRARAHRAAGDDDAALADYEAALGEVEKQRAMAGSQSIGVLDTAAEIIDDTIELRLTRGEAEAAFRVCDRARGSAAEDLRVPPHAMVIEYAVLPHAIAIFCASRDGVTALKVAVERRELAGRVESLASRIRRRADGREDAAALFRWLIAPVRAQLANAAELVIVPDHELYGVPFAALFDAQRGRFLIEDFTLRFATSAAAFSPPPSEALSPAVVIADPPTARWPRLPRSLEEAQRVAALYRAELVAGEDATRARFVDAAARNALIHYAGHADSDARDSFGALLLAGDAGTLGTSEIARLQLRQHPLVVLAACGTFRGDAMHVAGMPSLARAFLTAGARAVVGTLWEIDDDVSAALFLRFHEHLRAGASPASALRAAQLELLRSANPRWRHPASWSVPAVLSNYTSGASK